MFNRLLHTIIAISLIFSVSGISSTYVGDDLSYKFSGIKAPGSLY